MKRTKLRKLLPILLTLITLIACTVGIVTAAETEAEDTRTSQITHATLVLDNNVDLLFFADISEEAAQSKETFVTFNDGAPVPYSGMQTIGDVTYAVYRYNNIAAKDLADVITAKLYVEMTLTSFLDYCPKDYCQYILTNSTSDTLKTLVSDLLVYGAEAQALENEPAETYATNGVTGLKPSATPDNLTVLYDTEKIEDLKNGEEVSIGQSKLSIENGMELTFNVDLPIGADPEDYVASLSINGRDIDAEIVSHGYYHTVSFKGIYVHELFDKARIGVYKDNVRMSNFTTLSLMSYIDELNNDSKYTAITNAYYNYSQAAHAYSGAHTVKMPGSVTADGVGSNYTDDTGTVVYSCALCGEIIDELKITHLRTFDDACSDGSINNGSDGVYPFNATEETEVLSDGTSNTYFSIVRDSEDNYGDASLGYYFNSKQADIRTYGDYINKSGEFTGTKFTFAFDVKAPKNGTVEIDFYIQNSTAGSAGRYGKFLDITTDGSIMCDNSRVAPAGTVNSKTWTNVTVTMDFYMDGSDPYICYEYYVNNDLATTISVYNPMLNDRFTGIYMTASSKNAVDGQGVLFDNFMFAQGCAHSFTESLPEHMKKVEDGSLRDIIDMVHHDFDEEQFSYVVRWDGKSNHTYTERQGLVTLPTDTYKTPDASPTSYQHPRVLFNSSDIPRIVANLESEENSSVYNSFISKVRTNTDGKLAETDKTVTNATHGVFENTNYNTSVLTAIEAKALYYALYKDDASGKHTDALLRGYQAIYAMKNYLLTFDVQWDMSDQCRMYGEVMYYTALVYDWCYDLLTEDDKIQFRLGVQNLCCDGTSNAPWLGQTHEGRKLEGGFPALAKENQTPLTGHGAEAQVLRDYFSFAIAVFDEDPSWYAYVGGMIYQNYVDARNYFYTSHYYPDGSAGYNCYRFLCDLYNAWLFKGMNAELPYNTEDMASVIHGLIAMETTDSRMFATADGSGGSTSSGQYKFGTNIADCAIISSYLFNDNVALAIAHEISGGYKSFHNSQLSISVSKYVILSSAGLEMAEDYQSYVDNYEYHGGFQQQIISRNSKDDDSVVVLMQGAQHYPGGHTHQNAGSFQIHYKGMLTRDDGLYDAYGSDHHFYYHMSATAHNTLLIYNHNLAENPLGPSSKTGYYNGGQKYELGIPSDFNAWVEDDKFSYGQLLGIQTDDEKNPSYVYFANDITLAYDSDTVDYVERSFMTLYTGDPETPMVMFVFDNITSDNSDYRKTFLLQCATEPTVNGNVVTVDNGEGKLVLTSLLGADDIKAYGRTSVNGVPGGGNGSERFYLSGPGKNLIPGGGTSIGDKNNDLGIVWGHVEISETPTDNTSHLMNVLYVSDSGTVVSATPTLLESGALTGAMFKNSVSMFVNDPMLSADLHTFTVTGDGTMTYYIGGLNEGTWEVSIDGEAIGEFQATEEGKMITFQGKAGEVTLTPGSDIRPANTSPIYYNLEGGKLPEGAVNYYVRGEVTVLPIPTKKDSTFKGWFTDKEFTNQIFEIPADATGPYKLYAKWDSPIIYLDYSKGGSMSAFSQIAYAVESVGTFKMMNEETNYLLWTTTGAGSLLTKDGKYSTYANLSLQVSFTLTVGKDDNNPLLPFQIYLRDPNSASGSTRYLNILQTDSNGNVYLGRTIPFDKIASGGMTTIRFVLDFEKGMMYGYNDNGELIASTSMAAAGIALPSEYASYEEWFRNLSASGGSLITMKGLAAGTLRVGFISVTLGNVSDSCANFGANSTMHKWDNGAVIREPSTTDCSPGVIVYTCTECDLTNELLIASDIQHPYIYRLYEDDEMTYTCDSCKCTFTPGNGYYLDGTSYSNIIGVGNGENFTTNKGTHQPVISLTQEYELINNTGKRGQVQLWIPSLGAPASNFSSGKNALGAISFKIDALTDEKFEFKFVDTSSDGTKWSPEWCIMDSFFTVSAPTVVDGNTVVYVTGWDGVVLKTVNVRSDKDFTDWIDVQILIEMDPVYDYVTLSYYIDGKFVATASKDLTIKSNAINSIYISGYTSALDSGIILDDIFFGYSINGSWTPEILAETPEEETPAE